MDYYTLDKNNNIKPCSLEVWAKLYETKSGQKKRRVAFTEIDGKDISTVFLGLDHNHWGGKPLLFETMVFARRSNIDYCERYSTYAEALAGHTKAVKWVLNGCKEDSE